MKSLSGTGMLVVALVAFALAVRLYPIGWGLPEIYEEATPFWTAWAMWGWGPGREFDPNPHFFTYPSLSIYLQFLGQGLLYLAYQVFGRVSAPVDFRALYEMDKTPFIVMGRFINASLGAATIVPAFYLALRAGGRAAAIPAAILVALSPVLIARSQVIEVDVPLTLFVALACLFAVRIREAPTFFNCAMAGLMAGLATSSKYPGLVALLPALTAIAIAARAPQVAAAERKRNAPRRARRSLAPWEQLAVLLGAFVCALFVTSPFVFLDAASAQRELSMAGEHMRLGHFGSEAGQAWLPYARAWFSSLMGVPLGIVSLAGLAYFAAWRRAPWAIVIASAMVPLVLVVGSWSRAADNYVMPLLPLATVFATVLVAEAARGTLLQRAGRWSAALVVAATVVFALPLIANHLKHLRTLNGDPRTPARTWIESNVSTGSLIATEQLGPGLLTVSTVLGWDPELRGALDRAGFKPRMFALEYLPMLTIAPEQSARFYELRLYEPADYLIVTGSVRGRYLKDPDRFRPQVAFYDSLDRSWTKVQEFPSRGAGSDIVIYRNPAHDRPFASRPPGPIPRLDVDSSSVLTGEEQAFYYNLGLAYEAFGFMNHAVFSYRVGLRLPSTRPERYTTIAQRAAGCLIRSDRTAEARELLHAAAGRAPNPREAAALQRALAMTPMGRSR